MEPRYGVHGELRRRVRRTGANFAACVIFALAHPRLVFLAAYHFRDCLNASREDLCLRCGLVGQAEQCAVVRVGQQPVESVEHPGLELGIAPGHRQGKLNIYIADKGNHVVRKVTASTVIITTLAGNGRLDRRRRARHQR
jgi:hypothetical protein